MKSAEEIMNMLEAFDLTGSLRDAGELSGVSHHTVARYVAAREAGALSDRPAARPQLIDEFLPKIEEWIERSKGKLRADRAHEKLLAVRENSRHVERRRVDLALEPSRGLERLIHPRAFRERHDARFVDLADDIDHHVLAGWLG